MAVEEVRVDPAGRELGVLEHADEQVTIGDLTPWIRARRRAAASRRTASVRVAPWAITLASMGS